MQQLALPFPTSEQSADDWVMDDSNAAAFALVMGWPNWPTPWAALWGPPASGKSHLARLWWRHSDALWLTPEQLAEASVHSAVLDMGTLDSLPLDCEEPLFHYMNNLRLAGCSLLITARTAPARWPVQLPDLASRLKSVLAIALEPGDEAFFERLLVALASQRGLELPEDVRLYLVKRLPRTADMALAAIEALQAQPRVSLPAARQALATFTTEEERSC